MPADTAIISPTVLLRENDTVNEALKVLDQNGLRAAPVVDADGRYLGMFSLSATFKALLPIAVTMEGGLDNVDFVVGATPGIAKKLKKIGIDRIAEHINKTFTPGHEETTLLEAMRLIVKQGSPLPLVNRKTDIFLGLVSEQSILKSLQHLKELMETSPPELSADDIALLKEFGVQV